MELPVIMLNQEIWPQANAGSSSSRAPMQTWPPSVPGSPSVHNLIQTVLIATT